MKLLFQNNDEKQTAKVKETSRKKLTNLHIIIAVVAIIECLILISFTTFSWIETASSLKILSGKKSIVDEDPSKIPIKSALNYEFKIKSATANVDDSENCADLNTFFSECGKGLYRYAETSSPDGKTFYFANPDTATYRFRKGDTTDFNTGYTYFDFTVFNGNLGSNGKATGKYEDNTATVKMKFEFADNDIFTVNPGTSGLNPEDTVDKAKLDAICNAMRISFQAGSGSAKIYSETPQTYDAQSGINSGTVTSVSTTAIAENQKLFAVSKNGTTRVSCRIWFEKNASNLTGITAEQLAGVKINVNLRLKYTNNEYDFVYFDDYTFSNAKENNGGHLTEDNLDESGHETDTYRMYFVYKPDGGTSSTVYPMTLDTSNSNPDAVRWVTCSSDGSPDAKLPTAQYNVLIGSGTQSSYFGYGACPIGATTESQVSSIYTWRLANANNVEGSSRASDESELVYNAFGLIQTAANTSYGAGGWAWSTPLEMVYFRDMATGLTNQPYNTGDNFKYITNAVNVAADTQENQSRNNVLYVNYCNSGVNTIVSNQYEHTAAMYYDKSLDGGKGLFKAWVPSYWLERQDPGKKRVFRYCPHNYYANCVASWASEQPTKSTGSDDYIYTALGSWEKYTTDYYDGASYSGHDGYITQGTGTWKKIEQQPVYLSAELIDNYMKPEYRFRIGVNLGGTVNYCALVPDETNTKFYAYIPDPKDGNPNSSAAYSADDITFEAFTFGGYTDAATPVYQAPVTKALWAPEFTRNGSNTFYPVKFLSTEDSVKDRGYWHISVIVDGTYEHLFWEKSVSVDQITGDETVTQRVLGNFSYNTTGHVEETAAGYVYTTDYNDITAYSLDEYRWYVPMENPAAYIYYRWEPYTGTILKFNHNTNDGIYCIVTEGKNDVPELLDSTTPVQSP